jgi:hypothetical protein
VRARRDQPVQAHERSAPGLKSRNCCGVS